MTYEYNSHGVSYTVFLKKHRYPNGRLALVLMGTDGEPVATATVNLPQVDLGPDEVCIKTWSENEAMLPFLIDHKIAEDTGRKASTGFVAASIVKLLV